MLHHFKVLSKICYSKAGIAAIHQYIVYGYDMLVLYSIDYTLASEKCNIVL